METQHKVWFQTLEMQFQEAMSPASCQLKRDFKLINFLYMYITKKNRWKQIICNSNGKSHIPKNFQNFDET